MERVATLSGVAVFFAGIALLAFTYYTAYSFLVNPEGLFHFSELFMQNSQALQSGLEVIIYPILSYILPVLLLFVMGYIASKIASQGVQMYRAR